MHASTRAPTYSPISPKHAIFLCLYPDVSHHRRPWTTMQADRWRQVSGKSPHGRDVTRTGPCFFNIWLKAKQTLFRWCAPNCACALSLDVLWANAKISWDRFSRSNRFFYQLISWIEATDTYMSRCSCIITQTPGLINFKCRLLVSSWPIYRPPEDGVLSTSW